MLVQSGLTIAAALDLAGCLVALYVSTALFCRLQPDLGSEPVDAPRWIRQVLIVAATSTIAIGLHFSSVPRLDSCRCCRDHANPAAMKTDASPATQPAPGGSAPWPAPTA